MTLTAIALNCTLKPSGEQSSTDRLLNDVLGALRTHSVEGEIVRIVDFKIAPGVTSDEGGDDEWPDLRQRILAADILIFGTPVWLGQPSSVAKRVLERMDAFLGETDNQSRMPSFSRVAMVAVVGNEDGAHHCFADIAQALNDVGFSLAANGMTYWVGEAMGSTDYKELPGTPRATKSATEMAVANTVHLAKLLQAKPYPGL